QYRRGSPAQDLPPFAGRRSSPEAWREAALHPPPADLGLGGAEPFDVGQFGPEAPQCRIDDVRSALSSERCAVRRLSSTRRRSRALPARKWTWTWLAPSCAPRWRISARLRDGASCSVRPTLRTMRRPLPSQRTSM